MVHSELLRVAGIVFVAVTLVVLGDTAGKLLTSGGVSPLIVAWSRFAIAAIVLLPLSGLSRAELRELWDWRVLLRAVFIVCGICSILTALKTEPIADVIGAFFIGPIVSYLLAMVFLGERPSAARSALLALGFFGVMLVVKPGFGLSFGLGMALVAGCCYGAYLVMTKLVAGEYRPRALLMSQLIIGALILTPIGLSVQMPELNLNVTLLLIGSASGSAAGNYLLVVASRMVEASLIAPLVYSQLISATVLGVLVFGDWPDNYSLAGLVLIAVSGFGSLLLVRQAPPKS